MPLPKDMGACMRKVKKEYPEGRSDKKMSKKAAHKQHVAMCMNVQEGYSLKDLVEGMTFSSFLIVEQMPGADTSTARGYMRSLPQYQEMMADQSVKPHALKLARQMVDEFGDGPIDSNAQDYILDRFDELSSQHYKGTSMGDWKGEADFQRRRSEERDIESAVQKWEQTTGMDAETGADIPEKRRRISGARTGMDFEAGKKAQQAKADLAAFANAPAPEQADRLVAARSRVAAERTPRENSKMSQARAIFGEDFGTKKASEIINRFVNELGMSKAGATTYYYGLKKKAA